MVLSVDMTDFVLRCYDQGFSFSPLIGGDLFLFRYLLKTYYCFPVYIIGFVGFLFCCCRMNPSRVA